MLVFVLILLLIAAVLGVLGTVLKLAAVLVLSGILAVVIFGALVWWAVKRQTMRFLDAGSSKSPPGSGQVYDAEGKVRRPDLPE